MRTRVALAALVAATSLAAVAAAQDKPPKDYAYNTIWLEGEAAAQAKTARHPWWYDQVQKDQLSGGDWLSNFSADAGPGTATYQFRAPKEGSYRLYLRVNPTRSGYSYAIDNGPPQKLDLGTAFDTANVAADNKPDLRFIGWVDAGEVRLTGRPQRMTVTIDGEVDHHGAIDAIVFTDDAGWTPQGKAKPWGAAKATVAAAEGTWAWDPARDRFSDDALLDLRYLNEDVAGQHGFVKADKNGDFVRGDGEPIRFWALTTGVYEKGMDALREHAKFLAKRGVNMVRYHGNVRNTKGPLGSINEEAREQLWQLVAAMKDEGIYVTYSPYYAHATPAGEARQNWGIPRDPSADNLGSLLFFDDKLQDAYKQWLRDTLVPVNPHTGVALKDDPAIAIIQIQNEDSLLFWTFNSLKGDDYDLLRKKFGQWLAKKHGSLEKARAEWEDTPAQGDRGPDDWSAGLIGFSNLWAWFQPNLNEGGLGKRMADEAEFIVTLQRDWNAEVVRFLREDIGAKHLINANNWKTADPLRLNDLERYTYTSTDIMGVNRYTGGSHEGENNGWAVVKGQKYTDESVLLSPGKLPVALKQPQGYPFIISEGLWVPPQGYQSEGPLLVAAYSSLNGFDAHYWFATGDVQWTEPKSANGYLPSVGKWVAGSPEQMGEFPAAALMFRKGYVKRGEPAVVEHRALADLYQRKAPIISEEGTFDPNRDAVDITRQSPVKTEVDRKAFLVGPVEVVYDSNPAKTKVANLSRYIDESAQTVASNTGELLWNHGDGFATVNAPKAQAATGFLSKAGEIKLEDVTIASNDEYATITVVSMDDLPLKASRKVLVQVGTVARPTGWATRGTTVTQNGKPVPAFEIVEHGKAPWLIRQTDTTLTLTNTSVTKATALDPNGMPQGEVEVQKQGSNLTLKLPTNAKYVVLQ